MSLTPVQILLAFYGGILAINIVVAVIQYVGDRTRAHGMLVFYWCGILLPSTSNAVLADHPVLLAVTCAAGTFLSQLILGLFLAEIKDVPLPVRPLVAFLFVSGGVSALVWKAGLGFTWYALPLTIGAAAPVFVCMYRVLVHGARRFTTVQKMFFIAALLMSLHYLDWPYTQPRPQYFLLGMAVAIALFHLQGILAAMTANEVSLQRRNEHLEDEVHQRADQLAAAERQLWESNRLASLGLMAGGVAHEINNPLSIIGMQMQTLRIRAEDGILTKADVLKKASVVQSVIERISKITESLRKVAKDEENGQRSAQDLRTLVEETQQLFADRIHQLHISHRSVVPAEPCCVTCSPAEITQVLVNLFSNAIDAVEPLDQKEILVTVRTDGARVELAVEDSGQIDPAIVPRIMDPFFTTKPVGRAMGLGLSISRAIAEHHGGRLYVDLSATHTRIVLELPKREVEGDGR